MNLFYLHTNPRICATYHCDKHTVKMIVELAQMLSTAHRVLDGELYIALTKSNRRIKRFNLDTNDDILYKATHVNHPSAKWVRETSANYQYTYELFIELCNEFTHRFGKTHATFTKLTDLLKVLPKNIDINTLTTVPQAMPEHCRMQDSVDAYRNYYVKEKSRMLKYTNREIPNFVTV